MLEKLQLGKLAVTSAKTDKKYKFEKYLSYYDLFMNNNVLTIILFNLYYYRLYNFFRFVQNIGDSLCFLVTNLT